MGESECARMGEIAPWDDGDEQENGREFGRKEDDICPLDGTLCPQIS